MLGVRTSATGALFGRNATHETKQVGASWPGWWQNREHVIVLLLCVVGAALILVALVRFGSMRWYEVTLLVGGLAIIGLGMVDLYAGGSRADEAGSRGDGLGLGLVLLLGGILIVCVSLASHVRRGRGVEVPPS